MRLVIQNVKNATCKVEDKVVGSISHGFLILVGFTHDDNELIVDKLVNKISKLRVFPDENGKTNLSLKDTSGEILSISQFTLYASIKDGNRPSFVDAMSPDKATKLYDYFNAKLLETGIHIEKGIFGADMKLNFTNDGPFTLMIDSKDF